ncbi:uncharacterized protein LOC101864238 [Aplysia californica]|uniref:Uncharacterized protein LOC101864238 n=1 Tax=Aplysia californica TaxID=6500 RepID=A0ABM1A4X8_APLCA|nr:uncharacterized protein LOC101864238 [Aplysia californica]
MTCTRIFSVGLPLLLSVVSMVTGKRMDLTRTPGAYGDAVVRASLSQIQESCVFQNDYLFLRRLAHVISDDGKAAYTFRKGFDGGIWQIPQAIYEQTRNVANIDYVQLQNALNITWENTTWNDLRKPLYSGLAAMLTLERLSPIPRDMNAQASYFATNFAGNASLFRKKIAGFDSACEVSGLDMAFVLDASGSIDTSEYRQSKKFTSDVLRDFNVAADSVRVALTTFSNGVVERIHFLDYNTTESLRKAVDSIGKNSGGTNTAGALDSLRTNTFTKKGNCRKEAAKIAIVQTDGNSDSRSRTIASADRLKKAGVTIFAIGVGGGIDEGELKSIASPPVCTHVRMISDFSELTSIVSDIKETACKTKVIQETNTTNVYKCAGQRIIKIQLSKETSIVTRPELGDVKLFGSFKITEPNSAYADFSGEAGDGKPTVIYLKDYTEPLYLSIISEETNEKDCNSTFLVKILDKNALIKTGASNLCVKDGQLQECSDIDYVKSGAYEKVNATDSPTAVCKGGATGYHAHPNTPTKYVYCAAGGEAYVVQCPKGFAYLPSQKDCIAPASENGQEMCQVCSTDNWELGLRNFPLVSNVRRYVHCSGVNDCQVKNCGDNSKYLPNDQKCNILNTSVSVHGSFLSVLAAVMWVAYFVRA